MARNYDKQNTANYGGFVHDFGQSSYPTTSINATITTTLSRIVSVSIVPAQFTTDAETYGVNEPSALTDTGIVVPADGEITIRRTVESGGSLTSDLKFFYHFIGID